MPLFNTTGVTCLKKTYYEGFALLSRERQADYEWALKALKRLYQQTELPAPATLLTDRDLGLLKAIQAVFPTSKHLLCLWHVEKNVLLIPPESLRSHAFEIARTAGSEASPSALGLLDTEYSRIVGHSDTP